MRFLLLFTFLSLAHADVPVTVKTRDERVVRGHLAIHSIEMKTNFGVVHFETDKIHSVEFGEPDAVTTNERIKLQGRIVLDEIRLKTSEGDESIPRVNVISIFTDRGPVKFELGKIMHGTARNGMSYQVRLPPHYSPEKGMPALAILHGSNMNASAYVHTIIAAWPKLADDYILIGINGEHRTKQSPDDNPTFNYSGVNYMGKSKYKGYPGTDRESPGLIPEVLRELQERLHITRIFLGGHSQGGFVTYCVYMNFPDLIAGAFPISAGPWIQSEPTAFDNLELRAAQRRRALAIVHGENDPAVPFSQGKSGFESFDDDGFPALRFFTDQHAGHMFARLPVEKAVRWLEEITSDDPASLLRFADRSAQEGAFRDATAALARLSSLDPNYEPAKVQAIKSVIEKAAEPSAKKLERVITTVENDSWTTEFFDFRRKFQFADAAQPVMKAYQELRARHEPAATKIWNEARQEFQKGNQSAGYSKYEEIVSKYYASSWYRYAKPALEKRRPGTSKQGS